MTRLLEHSTQYRNWRFSHAELQARRQRANETARARAAQARKEEARLKGEAASADAEASITYVTVEDELALCQYFAQHATDICKRMKLNDLVRATAIGYYRRFYLDNSVLEYDPKSIITTCIFLASKAENAVTKLSELAAATKTDAQRIKELEFTIATSFNFQFWIRHPFEASWGLFLDLQALDKEKGGTSADRTGLLTNLWRAAGRLIATAVITDLPFLYMPSQIALGCWQVACKEAQFSLDENYLARRFTDQERAVLRPVLDDITKCVQECRSVDKQAATAVNDRLKVCRNLEYNPESLVYKRRVEASQAADGSTLSSSDEEEDDVQDAGASSTNGTHKNPFA
ncbi:hypothetical protein RI367_001322 [Sorochytrium milnesiophthora]